MSSIYKGDEIIKTGFSVNRHFQLKPLELKVWYYIQTLRITPLTVTYPSILMVGGYQKLAANVVMCLSAMRKETQ